MLKYLSLVLLVIFLFSCNCYQQVDKPKKSGLLSYEIIDQGAHSGIKKTQNVVFNSKEEFYNFFKNYKVPKSEININFNKHTVVGIFLGQQTTGSISINIQKIVDQDNKVIIFYTVKAGAIATMVMTEPYLLIQIPKTNKPIDFQLLK